MSTQLAEPSDVDVAGPVSTARDFKALAGSFLTGVAVVLTEDDGAVEGCTISSLASVSLEPPLLLFCITQGSRTLEAMRENDAAGLSILGFDAESMETASRFARPGPKYIDRLDLERTPGGGLVLRNSLAAAELRIHREHPAGDHVIVVAAPTWTRTRTGSPLAYWRSELFDPRAHL